MDKRADIFAFGVVLYEMLTGTRAFEDEDVSMTLSKVLQREPDFDALPPTVPPGVCQALRLCLRKDPKQRVADIRDVRLALEGAFETVAPERATTSSLASGGRLAWIAFAVAAVVIVVIAVPTLRHLQETPPPGPPETRLEIVTPRTDQPESFALSPDGRQIVFAASGEGASRLWLRPLATTTAEPLQGTEGARLPFWSPDGRSIGFFADTALKRFDLGGGAPRTLVVIAAGQGGTWNTDGVIVFAPSTTSALLRVSATGDTPVAVTQLGPRQQGHVRPYFLPDGRRFLFVVSGAPDTAGVYMGALDGGASTRLTPGGLPAFLPSGWLQWVRGGTLLAQRLDVSKAALIGEPVTLADGVGAVSMAAAGPVAYRKAGGSQQQLTWFDRSGMARGTVGDPDASLLNPRVSPDGRRVVVSRTVQGNQDLWLLDSARMSRFTFDPANDRFPVWSPDGARIVFNSTRAGGGDLYVKLASGAGAEERLPAPEQFKLATSWSADGRFLLYQRTDSQTSSDLWVAEMVGDHKSSVILQTPFAERFGMFSPDGRLLAYQSNESGRNEIYVRPFVPPGESGASGAGSQWQVSTAGGIMPAWRPDGKELYYLNPTGAMMAAPITVSGAAVVPGAPTMLFPTRIYGGGVDNQQAQQYDVARDGRFLINTVLDGAPAPITLLQNWKPASK